MLGLGIPADILLVHTMAHTVVVIVVHKLVFFSPGLQIKAKKILSEKISSVFLAPGLRLGYGRVP